MRYAARRDANHAEILRVFETMLGCVTDTSGVGGGAGDAFVSYGHYGAWIEIKSSDVETLTPAQDSFHALHKGCCFRVETTQQAESTARLIRARGMALASIPLLASPEDRSSNGPANVSPRRSGRAT
jgi:hypothetical protein